MSEAKKIIPMQVWAILDPERYIKKSIKDWSLAVYDEKASADRQIESISSANNEECFIEELSLCNKVKFDEYVEVHNEMYGLIEDLRHAISMGGIGGGINNSEVLKSIDEALTRARGEKNA